MTDMSWFSKPGDQFAELSSPKSEIRKGAILAAAFFGGLLGWAALTPLDAGAMSEGVVAVSGNRQAVQHREGGIVTVLKVTEGQSVVKGQELLKISESETVATERGLAGEVIALLALQARLRAEQQHLNHVASPPEYRTVPAQDVSLAEEALAGQRQLFMARRASILTERGVLGQRIGQHQEQIAGYRHQMRSNQVQQELIGQELTGLRSLVDRGFVSITRIREMERGAAQLDGQYGSFEAETARTGKAIGETRMEILSLDRKLAEEVATELRQTQIRLAELQPRLIAAREHLQLSTVRAPAAGRVVGLKIFTVGGVIAPGEKLMEIVPQDRALVIDGKVSPNDADDLYPGMATQVRFSALQQRDLPILTGHISKVSADGFDDERTGARFFRIEVTVPPSEIAKIHKLAPNSGLRAGLPAEVLIPLKKRNALSYLIEPLTQTLWRAGREH